MVKGFKEEDKPEDALDKDGKIDMQTSQGQQRLTKIFKTFDTNNDQNLDAEEIYKALRKADQKVSYGYIYRLMREFDENHDGVISLKEFKLMFLHIQNDSFDDFNEEEEKILYQKLQDGLKKVPSEQITPDITRSDLEKGLGNKLNGTLKDEAEKFVKSKYSAIIKRNKELVEENQKLL